MYVPELCPTTQDSLLRSRSQPFAAETSKRKAFLEKFELAVPKCFWYWSAWLPKIHFEASSKTAAELIEKGMTC